MNHGNPGKHVAWNDALTETFSTGASIEGLPHSDKDKSVGSGDEGPGSAADAAANWSGVEELCPGMSLEPQSGHTCLIP